VNKDFQVIKKSSKKQKTSSETYVARKMAAMDDKMRVKPGFHVKIKL